MVLRVRIVGGRSRLGEEMVGFVRGKWRGEAGSNGVRATIAGGGFFFRSGGVG